jgi:hypothetical protein
MIPEMCFESHWCAWIVDINGCWAVICGGGSGMCGMGVVVLSGHRWLVVSILIFNKQKKKLTMTSLPLPMS